MRRGSGYPLWLRCWHWGNALLFVILLITGLNLHFSNAGPPPFGFRGGVLIHNTAGALLTLFYCLFLFGNLFLGNGRYYKVVYGDIEPGLIRQARYYLWGIFVRSPHPYPHSEERKFNPLQKLFYLVVMYALFPLLTVTGWALLFPDRLPDQILGEPGIGLWALAHTYTGFSIALFMVVHVYLGTTGATIGQLFRFMWFGHVDTEPPATMHPPELGVPVLTPKEHS
jgi:thiosulfate reductase cytochrome b subunit